MFANRAPIQLKRRVIRLPAVTALPPTGHGRSGGVDTGVEAAGAGAHGGICCWGGWGLRRRNRVWVMEWKSFRPSDDCRAVSMEEWCELTIRVIHFGYCWATRGACSRSRSGIGIRMVLGIAGILQAGSGRQTGRDGDELVGKWTID